jgi:SAM-dependent methyltransferase
VETYEYRDGIWSFLPATRAARYATFLEQYEIVRRTEKWGQSDADFYRALPETSTNDPNREIWQLRRRAFRAFIRQVLTPIEVRAARPLHAIDLGAGNGWLAYRLALRGHHVAAVDLRVDRLDGLGAHVHYNADFEPVQADFGGLPFADAQFDLAVFNASLHYAEDCESAMQEALRVLRPTGRLVILDSPFYRDDEDGRRMVHERDREFLSRFGFSSSVLGSEHFLTAQRLDELAAAHNVSWRRIRRYAGVQSLIRSLAAVARGRRRPATFPVIEFSKPNDSRHQTLSMGGNNESVPTLSVDGA